MVKEQTKNRVKKKQDTGKKRLIILITFIIIFQIAILFLITFTYFQNLSAKNQINQSITDLQQQIIDNKIETQANLNQLSNELISTKQDLSEVKATASADFSGIIEDTITKVVSIKTDVSQASGFIISSDGLIVTNAHVLSQAHYAKAQTYSGKLIDCELIGYDLTYDVAVLQVEGTYFYLEFGNSDDVKVGEKVIALGNPLGLSFTATEGIVSAVHRPGLNDLNIYIQTDVPLNPGNSGGPLIDKQGKVIGITNFKISGYESLGFALESNSAVDVINEITNRTISVS